MKRQLLISIEPDDDGIRCGDCNLIDDEEAPACKLTMDWLPGDDARKHVIRTRTCLEAEALASGLPVEQAKRHPGICRCHELQGLGVEKLPDGRCDRCGRPVVESPNRWWYCTSCRKHAWLAPHGDKWLCESCAPAEG